MFPEKNQFFGNIKDVGFGAIFDVWKSKVWFHDIIPHVTYAYTLVFILSGDVPHGGVDLLTMCT